MFKKTLVLFIIILLVSACSPNQSTATDSILEMPTATTEVTKDVIDTQDTATPAATSQSNANDACNNRYYPVVNGASWTYQNTVQGETPFTEIDSISINEDGTFTITVTVTESETVLNYGSCENEGVAIFDSSYFSGDYTDNSNGSSHTTFSTEGVTIPNDIQVGDEWSQTLSTDPGSAGGDPNSSLAIEVTYKALGYETVTVPAGTFQALKIEQSNSLPTESFFAALPHRFTWYAEGVGIVKSELEGISLSELVSYTLP